MIDFTKLNGLVPAVIQDADTREVLMVGFMNQVALEETRRSGFVTFFSRTRHALWRKGETSGNRLAVDRIFLDCDDDTVLVLARVLGDGNVCHTGARSCFSKELAAGGSRSPECAEGPTAERVNDQTTDGRAEAPPRE
jgi:phosphoribosyl-ATP pyrophosphohydrolase/phosphoribosyl-AMP cyclohydrolase